MADKEIAHPHRIDAFSGSTTIAFSKYAEKIKVIITVEKGELAQSYKQYDVKGFIFLNNLKDI